MSAPAPATTGWIVPEYILHDTLTAGLAALTDQIEAGTIDSYMQRIFKNLDLERRRKQVEYFAKTTIKVTFNFPQTHTDFPCYAILLTADDQSQFVGDQGGEAIFADGSRGDVTAEAWNTTLGVATLAEHPEVATWMYQFAKWTLAANRRRLGSQFGLMQKLAGRDLGFVQEYRPRFIYRRDLYWSVQYIQRDADVRQSADVESIATNAAETDVVGLLEGIDVAVLSNL